MARHGFDLARRRQKRRKNLSISKGGGRKGMNAEEIRLRVAALQYYGIFYDV